MSADVIPFPKPQKRRPAAPPHPDELINRLYEIAIAPYRHLITPARTEDEPQ